MVEISQHFIELFEIHIASSWVIPLNIRNKLPCGRHPWEKPYSNGVDYSNAAVWDEFARLSYFRQHRGQIS